jgi:hypothetical protein
MRTGWANTCCTYSTVHTSTWQQVSGVSDETDMSHPKADNQNNQVGLGVGRRPHEARAAQRIIVESAEPITILFSVHLSVQ